jgi:hypothetical protein
MDFGEIVAATAVGGTVPVLVAHWLNRRKDKQQAEAWNQSGFGRYMNQAVADVDEIAAKLADERESGSD